MGNIQCEQKLNSVQFVKLFNDISNDYSAGINLNGDVTIKAGWDSLPVARLRRSCGSQHWLFKYECAYSWKELDLMAKLAATSPELRGGINND